MDSDSQATELMSLAVSTGRSPEEVCRECPELIESVRQKLAEYRRVEGQIQAWFPSPSRGSECDKPGAAVPPRDSSLMPEIPGYEVESILGRGGMGVVYRAKHLRLNRWVAVKILAGGVQSEADKLERFLREAEVVACLQHPNIVQVHDIGEFNGQSYFTMELMEGGSLAQKLSGAPQPAKYAAELIATLAAAIHVAHQRGIIHRDLKPSNILFSADGTPKISDFGLARRAEVDAGDLTLAGVPIGTPSYMSPCQAKGLISAMGPSTDIYSLGAILFEALTGRPPFRGESPADTTLQVINDPPVLPSRLNPKVPRDLETICLKCLEKEPARRYSSAQALAEDLRRFERHEPIMARPVGPVERAARWSRRKPALAGALSLGVVLALALAVTVLWWYGQRTALRASAIAWAQADLAEADRRRETGELGTAAALLQRAKDRLGGYVPPELGTAINRAAVNLKLAEGLDSIRSHRVQLLGGVEDKTAADRNYQSAFVNAGLAVAMDDQAIAAARIRELGMTEAIVAALDDWAVATQDERRRAWCLEVAELVNTSPSEWTSRLRNPQLWADRAALLSTIRSAPTDELPPHLVAAVAERLQDLGSYDEAITLLKRVERKYPGDFGIKFRLGFALMGQQRSAEAVGYYRAAFALRPKAVVSNNLGLALKGAGQIDDAISSYEEAIRLDARFAPAHMNLGVALKSKGKAEQALDCFRRAVDADPTFAQAHNNLANALKASGDVAGAIEHYEHAARLDATLAEPHYNLGLLFAGQGRADEAMKQYEEAVRLLPDLYQAHNNLGVLLADRKEWEQALAHLRRAVELAPNDAISRTSLGKALLSQGIHLNEALEQLREGARLRPDGANQHVALGQALLAQGYVSEAESSLRRALELLPESDSRRAAVEQSLAECRAGLAAERGKARKPSGG